MSLLTGSGLVGSTLSVGLDVQPKKDLSFSFLLITLFKATKKLSVQLACSTIVMGLSLCQDQLQKE
jgi:hypothetical protein